MNVRYLLSVVLAGFCLSAIAQKPALVKDIDANGRTPYVNTVFWTCPLANPSACAEHVYSFPPVPAGYRLVVGYVSAQFVASLTDPSQLDLVSLNNGQSPTDTNFGSIDLPPATCAPNQPNVRNTCVAHGSVLFYVEPNMTPNVVIHTGDLRAWVNHNTQVTIVGYLISAN